MGSDNRRIVLFIAISVALMFLWEKMLPQQPRKPAEQAPPAPTAEAPRPAAPSGGTA